MDVISGICPALTLKMRDAGRPIMRDFEKRGTGHIPGAYDAKSDNDNGTAKACCQHRRRRVRQ
jgi:hypothetical protein